MVLSSAHNTLIWGFCALLQARCSASRSALPSQRCRTMVTPPIRSSLLS